ncbi:hypothetical protein D8B26_005361 [Coccidioides posadasii str. Silveira]|uniref:Uncharacterized protein n=1 Tax=Coccidioides posadasii (strain RMSCC 757 / Silveira) TaxID=443226 RepID=E9D522_COCPS|nr:conserved hypothetical protein [Coccidioides posadasii str. Silveira]QVM10708.1 hypothetical protein D8B26_005361 [Coccidioides posadasii str. Silveira]
MEGDLWKSDVKRHLNGLVQAFEQRNDSKALADYFRGVGNELDQTGALDFEPFQQFWYRHKRVVALQNVKKRLSTGTGNARSDASYQSRRRAETDFESDDVLSITDNWDMESSRLQEFKDEVQRSLRDDRDFFEPDQVNTPSNSGNELIEAEKAFTAAEKDANGAHRVFRLQLLALRLRSLRSEAAQHCGGSRIPMDKRITTYFAEKCWAHLDTKVRKEKREKLARWRGYGEKWLALTEPAIVLAFGHIPSDNRWFTEFERRRFPIAAFNAVVGTLQAASIIHDLRKLWCLQLSRNRLSIRFHPERCFCEGTDAVLSDGVTLSPEPLAERTGRHQRYGDSIDNAEQLRNTSKRPSALALAASKRPRFQFRDEDVVMQEIGRDGLLTSASHGRVSDTDDVGNEQSSHESSPSSAAEHAPAENSVEAITPAEGTVIPQPLTPLIEMLHRVVPHDKRSESGQASASRRAEFSPENNTWTPGETASRPSADSNELQIRNETASVLNIESPGRNTGLSHDLHMGSGYNAGLPQSESGGSIDANTSLHPSNLIYSGNWDWNFNPMLDSWDQNYAVRPSLSEITQGNFSSWDQNYTLFE